MVTITHRYYHQTVKTLLKRVGTTHASVLQEIRYLDVVKQDALRKLAPFVTSTVLPSSKLDLERADGHLRPDKVFANLRPRSSERAKTDGKPFMVALDKAAKFKQRKESQHRKLERMSEEQRQTYWAESRERTKRNNAK